MPALRRLADGIEVDLQVQPRSSKEAIAAPKGEATGQERYKVHLQAPPVDGAANEALRVFLAEVFAVARSQVVMVRGATGRKKTVKISGEPQTLCQRLEEKTGKAEH